MLAANDIAKLRKQVQDRVNAGEIVKNPEADRIEMRAQGLFNTLSDIERNFESSRAKIAKFVKLNVDKSQKYAKALKKKLAEEKAKCDKVAKTCASVRDTVLKQQRKYATSDVKKAEKMMQKANYLLPIKDNVANISKILNKLSGVAAKVETGMKKLDIGAGSIQFPFKDFGAILEGIVKNRLDEDKKKHYTQDDIDKLDAWLDKLEKKLNELGQNMTFKSFELAYVTGVQSVQTLTNSSSGEVSVSRLDEKKLEQNAGCVQVEMEKVNAPIAVDRVEPAMKTAQTTAHTLLDSVLSRIVGENAKYACRLGFTNALATRVYMALKGVHAKLKEYDKQIDKLLVTAKSIAKLVGKTLYKLLPAAVGIAAGVSGMLTGLIETIGWLISAIGYGAFDLSDYYDGLKETADELIAESTVDGIVD